ncbi:MAG TPA: glutathione S-transferase family protein [Gaiellaceae bacterium]|jgi:glutathione S-transferase|nr:glutathione S-transferase family protein [Gaiellaceae bacterium]
MLLYDSGVSGNCYKVRLLLSHLGLDYERRELDVVDRSNRQEVLGDLNPGLRVPTLVLDDGRALGESGAILNYLADGTSYIPEDRYDRARMLQWMFFEQYSHEPYVAVPRFWLTKNVAVDPETLAERQRVGYVAFDAMESHLAGDDYLAAARYTLADIALYAYTHVADEGGFDMSGYPAIGAWIDRVASQPGHVPITA